MLLDGELRVREINGRPLPSFGISWHARLSRVPASRAWLVSATFEQRLCMPWCLAGIEDSQAFSPRLPRIVRPLDGSHSTSWDGIAVHWKPAHHCIQLIEGKDRRSLD